MAETVLTGWAADPQAGAKRSGMSYARRIIRGVACLGWLLAPGALSAQTATWEGFVEGWRRTPRPPLSLLASKGLLTAGYRASDDQLVRLVATL